MPQFLATRAVQWVTEHNVVRGKKGEEENIIWYFWEILFMSSKTFFLN